MWSWNIPIATYVLLGRGCRTSHRGTLLCHRLSCLALPSWHDGLRLCEISRPSEIVFPLSCFCQACCSSEQKNNRHQNRILSVSFLLHLPVSLNLCSKCVLYAIASNFILSCLRKLLYQAALPFLCLNMNPSGLVFHPPYMCHTAQRFRCTRASTLCVLDFLFFFSFIALFKIHHADSSFRPRYGCFHLLLCDDMRLGLSS